MIFLVSIDAASWKLLVVTLVVLNPVGVFVVVNTIRSTTFHLDKKYYTFHDERKQAIRKMFKERIWGNKKISSKL